MIRFIHCGSEKRVYRYTFPSGNQLADAREVDLRCSLIKSLTPFEDDAEIRLLNFLMQFVCIQPRDTFIKMALPKIGFYFEVFKQLKNHVLSYLTGAT